MIAKRLVAIASIVAFGLAALVVSIAIADTSADSAPAAMPEMPAPQREHEWLQRFVGQWRSEGKCSMGPDMPPIESKGTQRARMLGGFWVVAEGHGELMEMQFESVLSLGYDAKHGKYIGTWIDSVTDHIWHYEGTLDSDRNVLTLSTRGPNFMQGGEVANFRDVIEFKSDDHYVMSSSLEGADGQWQTMMTAHFYRTK